VQTLTYLDTKGGSYHREVDAVQNNVTYNAESGSLARGGFWGFPWFTAVEEAAHIFGAIRTPGRGRKP
jgi:hypothetical protein